MIYLDRLETNLLQLIAQT